MALQKARAREVGARTDDRKNFSAPPVFWLAPQSDHGSAARAETVAFFHYGPQSFFEPSWLALPKARAREVGATMMTGRKFLRPPLLWLAIRSRECRVKLFSNMARCNAFSSLTQLARSPYKKHARGKLAQRLMTGRKFLSPPPLMARSAVRSWERRARGN